MKRFLVLLAFVSVYVLGFIHGEINQFQAEKKIWEILDPTSGPETEVLKVRRLSENERVFLRAKEVTIGGETHQIAVAELKRFGTRNSSESNYFMIRVVNDDTNLIMHASASSISGKR